MTEEGVVAVPALPPPQYGPLHIVRIDNASLVHLSNGSSFYNPPDTPPVHKPGAGRDGTDPDPDPELSVPPSDPYPSDPSDLLSRHGVRGGRPCGASKSGAHYGSNYDTTAGGGGGLFDDDDDDDDEEGDDQGGAAKFGNRLRDIMSLVERVCAVSRALIECTGGAKDESGFYSWPLDSPVMAPPQDRLYGGPQASVTEGTTVSDCDDESDAGDTFLTDIHEGVEGGQERGPNDSHSSSGLYPDKVEGEDKGGKTAGTGQDTASNPSSASASASAAAAAAGRGPEAHPAGHRHISRASDPGRYALHKERQNRHRALQSLLSQYSIFRDLVLHGANLGSDTAAVLPLLKHALQAAGTLLTPESEVFSFRTAMSLSGRASSSLEEYAACIDGAGGGPGPLYQPPALHTQFVQEREERIVRSAAETATWVKGAPGPSTPPTTVGGEGEGLEGTTPPSFGEVLHHTVHGDDPMKAGDHTGEHGGAGLGVPHHLTHLGKASRQAEMIMNAGEISIFGRPTLTVDDMPLRHSCNPFPSIDKGCVVTDTVYLQDDLLRPPPDYAGGRGGGDKGLGGKGGKGHGTGGYDQGHSAHGMHGGGGLSQRKPPQAGHILGLHKNGKPVSSWLREHSQNVDEIRERAGYTLAADRRLHALLSDGECGEMERLWYLWAHRDDLAAVMDRVERCHYSLRCKACVEGSSDCRQCRVLDLSKGVLGRQQNCDAVLLQAAYLTEAQVVDLRRSSMPRFFVPMLFDYVANCMPWIHTLELGANNLDEYDLCRLSRIMPQLIRLDIHENKVNDLQVAIWNKKHHAKRLVNPGVGGSASRKDGRAVRRRYNLLKTHVETGIVGVNNKPLLLKRLDASMNRLSKLPSEIIFLTSLQELYLSRNKLESLPVGIGKCKDLKYLDLSYNLLEDKGINDDCNHEMTQLLQLRVLLLQGNRLQRLPENIGNLKRLIKINVSAQKQVPPPSDEPAKPGKDEDVEGGLVMLPKSLGNCIALEILDASMNSIKKLDSSTDKTDHQGESNFFGQLQRLKHLDLSCNRLMSPSIGDMSNCLQLCSINLSHNNLDTMPAGLLSLPKLKPEMVQLIPNTDDTKLNFVAEKLALETSSKKVNYTSIKKSFGIQGGVCERCIHGIGFLVPPGALTSDLADLESQRYRKISPEDLKRTITMTLEPSIVPVLPTLLDPFTGRPLPQQDMGSAVFKIGPSHIPIDQPHTLTVTIPHGFSVAEGYDNIIVARNSVQKTDTRDSHAKSGHNDGKSRSKGGDAGDVSSGDALQKWEALPRESYHVDEHCVSVSIDRMCHLTTYWDSTMMPLTKHQHHHHHHHTTARVIPAKFSLRFYAFSPRNVMRDENVPIAFMAVIERPDCQRHAMDMMSDCEPPLTPCGRSDLVTVERDQIIDIVQPVRLTEQPGSPGFMQHQGTDDYRRLPSFFHDFTTTMPQEVIEGTPEQFKSDVQQLYKSHRIRLHVPREVDPGEVISFPVCINLGRDKLSMNTTLTFQSTVRVWETPAAPSTPTVFKQKGGDPLQLLWEAPANVDVTSYEVQFCKGVKNANSGRVDFPPSNWDTVPHNPITRKAETEGPGQIAGQDTAISGTSGGAVRASRSSSSAGSVAGGGLAGGVSGSGSGITNVLAEVITEITETMAYRVFAQNMAGNGPPGGYVVVNQGDVISEGVHKGVGRGVGEGEDHGGAGGQRGDMKDDTHNHAGTRALASVLASARVGRSGRRGSQVGGSTSSLSLSQLLFADSRGELDMTELESPLIMSSRRSLYRRTHLMGLVQGTPRSTNGGRLPPPSPEYVTTGSGPLSAEDEECMKKEFKVELSQLIKDLNFIYKAPPAETDETEATMMTRKKRKKKKAVSGGEFDFSSGVLKPGQLGPGHPRDIIAEIFGMPAGTLLTEAVRVSPDAPLIGCVVLAHQMLTIQADRANYNRDKCRLLEGRVRAVVNQRVRLEKEYSILRSDRPLSVDQQFALDTDYGANKKYHRGTTLRRRLLAQQQEVALAAAHVASHGGPSTPLAGSPVPAPPPCVPVTHHNVKPPLVEFLLCLRHASQLLLSFSDPGWFRTFLFQPVPAHVFSKLYHRMSQTLDCGRSGLAWTVGCVAPDVVIVGLAPPVKGSTSKPKSKSRAKLPSHPDGGSGGSVKTPLSAGSTGTTGGGGLSSSSPCAYTHKPPRYHVYLDMTLLPPVVIHLGHRHTVAWHNGDRRGVAFQHLEMVSPGQGGGGGGDVGQPSVLRMLTRLVITSVEEEVGGRVTLSDGSQFYNTVACPYFTAGLFSSATGPGDRGGGTHLYSTAGHASFLSEDELIWRYVSGLIKTEGVDRRLSASSLTPKDIETVASHFGIPKSEMKCELIADHQLGGGTQDDDGAVIDSGDSILEKASGAQLNTRKERIKQMHRLLSIVSRDWCAGLLFHWLTVDTCLRHAYGNPAPNPVSTTQQQLYALVPKKAKKGRGDRGQGRGCSDGSGSDTTDSDSDTDSGSEDSDHDDTGGKATGKADLSSNTTTGSRPGSRTGVDSSAPPSSSSRRTALPLVAKLAIGRGGTPPPDRAQPRQGVQTGRQQRQAGQVGAVAASAAAAPPPAPSSRRSPSPPLMHSALLITPAASPSREEIEKAVFALGSPTLHDGPQYGGSRRTHRLNQRYAGCRQAKSPPPPSFTGSIREGNLKLVPSRGGGGGERGYDLDGDDSSSSSSDEDTAYYGTGVGGWDTEDRQGETAGTTTLPSDSVDIPNDPTTEQVSPLTQSPSPLAHKGAGEDGKAEGTGGTEVQDKTRPSTFRAVPPSSNVLSRRVSQSCSQYLGPPVRPYRGDVMLKRHETGQVLLAMSKAHPQIWDGEDITVSTPGPDTLQGQRMVQSGGGGGVLKGQKEIHLYLTSPDLPCRPGDYDLEDRDIEGHHHHRHGSGGSKSRTGSPSSKHSSPPLSKTAQAAKEAKSAARAAGKAESKAAKVRERAEGKARRAAARAASSPPALFGLPDREADGLEGPSLSTTGGKPFSPSYDKTEAELEADLDDIISGRTPAPPPAAAVPVAEDSSDEDDESSSDGTSSSSSSSDDEMADYIKARKGEYDPLQHTVDRCYLHNKEGAVAETLWGPTHDVASYQQYLQQEALKAQAAASTRPPSLPTGGGGDTTDYSSAIQGQQQGVAGPQGRVAGGFSDNFHLERCLERAVQQAHIYGVSWVPNLGDPSALPPLGQGHVIPPPVSKDKIMGPFLLHPWKEGVSDATIHSTRMSKEELLADQAREAWLMCRNILVQLMPGLHDLDEDGL